MTKEQREALETMMEYCPKLVNGIKNVADELLNGRKDDTDEYLLSVINGMNWVIEIINGTMDVYNGDIEKINKEETNELFVSFSLVYQKKNDEEIAEFLQEKLLPFFERVEEMTSEILL